MKILQMCSAQWWAAARGITDSFYLKGPAAIKTTLTGPFCSNINKPGFESTLRNNQLLRVCCLFVFTLKCSINDKALTNVLYIRKVTRLKIITFFNMWLWKFDQLSLITWLEGKDISCSVSVCVQMCQSQSDEWSH